MSDSVPHRKRSPSTSSSDASSKRRKSSKRSASSKRKNNEQAIQDDDLPDGEHPISGFDRRRESTTRTARDPRDEFHPPKKRKVPKAARKEAEAPVNGTVVTRSPTPVIDFDGLSRPSAGTRERLEESPEQAVVRLDRMRGAVRTLLECVGEDPDREGILDTPERYAKAMLFFTKGYQENVQDIVNNALFNEGHNEMVIVKDIELHSLCEHHLVPFFGKMHIGYIPSKTVIGLSKLPRIAEMFARRLQVQERLTKEVANAIMEICRPQGVAVVMEASHQCMVMRGVEKTGTSTITSCVLGAFEKKSKTRNEFLSLIGVSGGRRL